MKTNRFVLILASLTLFSLAHSSELAPARVTSLSPTPATVNVPTTVSDLAIGFAGAVQQMSLKGLVIFYRGDKNVAALRDIRTVSAVGGVLLITFSGGDKMAISAEKILLITDGTHTP